MAQPLFSVVVPTRNRPETLAFCLKTCLDQDFDDYEVIVCDNAGSPATREVVDATGSPRVVYLRSPEPLAMSANWELALSKASGTYVTVIGDDDGLMPFALRELARIVRERDMPPAVHWRCAHFNWPTITVPSEANFLALPLTRFIVEKNGRTELLRAARYDIGHDTLPMINTAIIRSDLIEDHRKRAGRVFAGLYPDVYTAYAFAFLCKTYLSVGVPMHVAGLSGRSNGVAALMHSCESPISREFYDLQREAGYRRHLTVPDYELFPVHADDSFQHAKDLLFPRDEDLTLDRRTMVLRYLAAIPDVGAEERERIKAAIRTSIADRPDLVEWYETAALDLPPCRPFRLKPNRLGFDGRFLLLDTTRFGIGNIHDAVRLATDLLQIDPGGIVFDMPDIGDVVGELDNTQSMLVQRSESLKTTLDDLATTRANLIERSNLLETTLDDLATTRASLTERSDLLETTLDDLATTRASLTERSDLLETTLDDLARTRASLTERSDLLETTLDDLARTRASLTERSDLLETTLDDLATTRASLTERSGLLEATLDDLATTRASLTERSDLLEATLDDLARTRASLTERSDLLKATLDDLAATRASLVERTGRLEGALAKLDEVRGSSVVTLKD